MDPSAADEPSDDYLMMAAAAGEHAAFTQLVERYEVPIKRFCRCMLGQQELAQEISQDVFLKLWSIRGRYQPSGRFKAFLFTVARNKCRSLNRKRRLRALVGMEQRPEPRYEPEAPTWREPVAEQPGPEKLAVSGETARIVASALDRLPEKFRVPLVMRFVEDLPYEDIAAVIGRTESTARSRVHYGLKHLAKLLPEEVGR